MSEVTKKVGAPSLPSVNLLPKDIAEKRQMRAVQITALLAIAIAVAVVVVAYVLALGARELAERDLASSREAQSEAVTERDAKASVVDAYRAQEVQEYTLAQIGLGEIDYAQLTTAVLATASDDTSFDNVTFELPSALGFSGVSSDPVFGGGIGAVTFAARAEDQLAATALIARIEQVPGVARVDATAEEFTTENDGSVYWSVIGSAVVTELRLSDRLMPNDGITGLDASTVVPELAGEETEPVPVPVPSPSAATEEES